MNINNEKYIERFNENLKIYNDKNNTNYTFEDVQNKFIDCKATPERYNDICMCGHHIKECYQIINPETNHSMILGSSCINTYMINSTIKCIDCNKKYRMINNKTKYCKDCKPIKKQCKECKISMTIKKSQKAIIDICYHCILDYQNRNKCKL